MEVRIFIATLFFTIAGCTSTHTNHFNKTLSKVGPSMIKGYMSGFGCNRIDNTEIVGVLATLESDDIKEHWRVTGCDKTHDLELTVSRDGNNVSAKKLN